MSVSDSARKELERTYAAIAELERRQREAPLLFYNRLLAGHAKQRQFHDRGRDPGVKKRFIFGGNRSGKTTAGSREALACMYGYRYWECEGLRLENGDLPHRDKIPTKHWVRRPDGIPIRHPSIGMVVSGQKRLVGIGQTVFPALHDALPQAVRAGKDQLKILRGAQGVPDWMQLPNGSKVLFAGGEQDDMSFEGFILDWCWIDEPIRQSIFNALMIRLFDFNGPIWMTATPITAAAAWTLGLKEDPPADTRVIEVFMEDNPANTPEKIRELVENGEMDEREKQARLYGRHEALADRVYDRFDPAVHVRRSFRPPADWIHGVTVDPHHKRPPFMAWWAYDAENRAYHFYREYPAGQFHKMKSGGLSPAETAAVIRGVEADRPVQYRLCDPRFGKAEHLRHGYQEAAWVDLMAQQGLYFDAQIPNVGDVERGHTAVSALLTYDKNFPISPTNAPRLYIHDCCENLITSFLRYGYIDVVDPVKGLFRKVSEQFKDPPDVVRYTVLWPIPVQAAEFSKFQTFSERDLREANDY